MTEELESSASASLWDYKPWWCQPWSILLTGVMAVLLSWVALHRLWLTLVVSAGVLAWWMLFLVLVPRAWRQAVLDGPTRAELE